jgi:hypothetical protein
VNTAPSLEDQTAVERVTLLADHYADEIMASLPAVRSEEELRRALAGAFINFLVDVLTLADSPT